MNEKTVDIQKVDIKYRLQNSQNESMGTLYVQTIEDISKLKLSFVQPKEMLFDDLIKLFFESGDSIVFRDNFQKYYPEVSTSNPKQTIENIIQNLSKIASQLDQIMSCPLKSGAKEWGLPNYVDPLGGLNDPLQPFDMEESDDEKDYVEANEENFMSEEEKINLAEAKQVYNEFIEMVTPILDENSWAITIWKMFQYIKTSKSDQSLYANLVTLFDQSKKDTNIAIACAEFIKYNRYVLETNIDSLPQFQKARLEQEERLSNSNILPQINEERSLPEIQQLSKQIRDSKIKSDNRTTIFEKSIGELPVYHQPSSKIDFWLQTILGDFGIGERNKLDDKAEEYLFTKLNNVLFLCPFGVDRFRLAIWAILKYLKQQFDLELKEVIPEEIKIVYICSNLRTLRQTVTQLRAGLKTQDIKVLELSEKVAVSTNEISQANIIVTTPGKLDVYTQSSPELWAKVQLLIVEDLQQLGENQAGPALERVMARLKKAFYSFKTRDQREDFRTVGFSSIVKNYKKLADYFFQAKLVIGIPHSESPVRWNFKFIEPKLEVMAELAPHELCLEELNSLLRNDKNVVVVVQNKREAEIFTKYMLKKIDSALLKKGFVQKPRDRIENEDLYSNFYQKRVAYFHGGMRQGDKETIAKAFDIGYLKIVVMSFNSLYEGLIKTENLLFRDIHYYHSFGEDLKTAPAIEPTALRTILQRTCKENSEISFIFPDPEKTPEYIKKIIGFFEIESKLSQELADSLLMEISAKRIQDMENAQDWFESTFCYMSQGQDDESKVLDASQDTMTMIDPKILQVIEELKKQRLITFDTENQKHFKVTRRGEIVALYRLDFRTVQKLEKGLQSFQGKVIGNFDILSLMAEAEEFQKLTLKNHEKRDIEKLSLLIKEYLQAEGKYENEIQWKVLCLLAAQVGRLDCGIPSLNLEANYISQVGLRVLRAMFDICRDLKLPGKTAHILGWCKRLESNQTTSDSPLKQFTKETVVCNPNFKFSGNNIPDEFSDILVQRLPFSKIEFITDIRESRLKDLDAEFGKGRGDILKKYAGYLPQLSQQVFIEKIDNKNVRINTILKVKVNYNPSWLRPVETFWITVYDPNTIYHVTKVEFNEIEMKELIPKFISLVVPYINENHDYTISFESDRLIVGLPCEENIGLHSFEDETCKKKFPIETCEKLKEYENSLGLTLKLKMRLYGNMSSVEMRCFEELHEQNKNIVISVPSQAERTKLILMAIHNARLKNQRVLIITPFNNEVSRKGTEIQNMLREQSIPQEYNELLMLLDSQLCFNRLKHYHCSETKMSVPDEALKFLELIKKDDSRYLLTLMISDNDVNLFDFFDLDLTTGEAREKLLKLLIIIDEEEIPERIRKFTKDLQEKYHKAKVEFLKGEILHDKEVISSSDIVVTSAQDWEMISRGVNFRDIMIRFGTVIIDDIQMIGDQIGVDIELFLMKYKFLFNNDSGNNNGVNCRIVALSDWIEDPIPLAEWLTINENFIYFEPSDSDWVRRTQLISIRDQENRRFWMDSCNEIIANYLKANTVKNMIVFAVSIEQVEKTATALQDYFRSLRKSGEVKIKNVKFEDEKLLLDEYVDYGVGLIHNRMRPKDIETMKNLYVNGEIRALVMLSNFANKIEFQAQLVIIKGTEYFDSRWRIYRELEIKDLYLMMTKQREEMGDCLLLVKESMKNYYERNLLQKGYSVESGLHHQIYRVLLFYEANLELVQQLMDESFLLRRLSQNKKFYESEKSEGQIIQRLCEDAREKLVKEGAITMQGDFNEWIVQEWPCKLAIQFGVLPSTAIKLMKLLNTTEKKGIKYNIFYFIDLLSEATEFENFPVRIKDKIINRDLVKEVFDHLDPEKEEELKIKELFRIPYGGRKLKIMLLHLIYFRWLNSVKREYIEYIHESEKVIEYSIRIVRLLMLLAFNNRSNQALFSLITLMQMIVQGIWYEFPLKILPHFHGKVMIQRNERLEEFLSMPEDKLKEKLESFELKEDDIEDIKEAMNHIPLIEFKCVRESDKERGEYYAKYQIIVKRGQLSVLLKKYKFPKIAQWYLVVLSKGSGKLLEFECICLESEIDTRWRRISIPKEKVSVHLISDSYMLKHEIAI